MSGRYYNKVVVVTGGSKGIGEGIVREFVKEGAIVCFCARGVEKGKQLETELNKIDRGKALFIQCDVTKEEHIMTFIDDVIKQYDVIDCLVNNAGWHPPAHTIDDVTTKDFRSLMNLNFIPYFQFAKYALPYLRKQKGNIINISSLAATIGEDHCTMYNATKGAITAWSKALSLDEVIYHVRVNSISPGNIWTPLWQEIAGGNDAIQQQGADQQIIGRFGTIEEIGKLAVYLAADGTFMTGNDIVISGGAELNFGQKNLMNK